MNCTKDSNIKKIILAALKEDTGRRDITTELTISFDKYAKAIILAKEDCVACGIDIAREVFKAQDSGIRFNPQVRDGQYVKKGKVLVGLEGRAASILTAERPALNFLSLLSGVATKTRVYVDRIKPYKAKIIDTRKTIPGLRALEKYAVRVGGGFNHRFSLGEMIMIKDNHLKIIGDSLWKDGFRGLKSNIPCGIKVEIEIKTLEEFKLALKSGPDIIMLDNMTIRNMRKAVKIRNQLSSIPRLPRPMLEASGGITLRNVRKVAGTGVDFISIGALTHSIKAIDISLEIICS